MKTELSSKQHIKLVMAAIIPILLLMIVIIAFITGVTQYGHLILETKSSTIMDADSTPLNSTALSGPHRKLLVGHEVEVEPNRMWGDKCSKSDIVITPGPTSPLPNGIPTYTVEIMNAGTTGCDISGIHVSCGWFRSARLINPRLFKRFRHNDCLVNSGKPLINGRTISFQYANTFPYPLSISSVRC